MKNNQITLPSIIGMMLVVGWHLLGIAFIGFLIYLLW